MLTNGLVESDRTWVTLCLRLARAHPNLKSPTGKSLTFFRYTKQRGAYKGRKKTLTPERADELVQRAGSSVPKAVLARDHGISRETVYQYLRHAKLD